MLCRPWFNVEICKEKKYTRSAWNERRHHHKDRIIDIDARSGDYCSMMTRGGGEKRLVHLPTNQNLHLGDKSDALLTLNDYFQFARKAFIPFYSQRLKNHLNEKPHIFGYLVADNKEKESILQQELKRKENERRRVTISETEMIESFLSSSAILLAGGGGTIRLMVLLHATHQL